MAGKASLKMWISTASNFSLIPSCSICQSCWQSKLFGNSVRLYLSTERVILSIYYYSSEKVPFRVDMQCSSLRAEAFLVFDRHSQLTLSWHITDRLPTVGRQTANSQPTVGRKFSQKVVNDSRPTARQLLADCQPTVGWLLVNSRPTVGRQFFGGAVLHIFPFSRVDILIKHEIRKYHIEVGTTMTKNCTSS